MSIAHCFNHLAVNCAIYLEIVLWVIIYAQALMIMPRTFMWDKLNHK